MECDDNADGESCGKGVAIVCSNQSLFYTWTEINMNMSQNNSSAINVQCLILTEENGPY